MAFTPNISKDRPYVHGGIWNSKIFGEFEEGDSKSLAVITGRLEIKTHKGNTRLFLSTMSITKRKSISEDVITFIPILYIYISFKKPKTRMIDIHKTGIRLPLINNNTDQGDWTEGSVNHIKDDYDISLNDIPNILQASGLVIIKLPTDSPITSEPIIYSIVYFQLSKLNSIKTLSFLQLKDGCQSIDNIASRAKTNSIPITSKIIESNMKSLSYYHKLSIKIWNIFNVQQDSEINFSQFIIMIDYADIFLLQSQALRFFNAVDIKKNGVIDMSQFEIFLIAYDVMGHALDELLILDIYDTLSIKQTVETTALYGLGREGLDYSGFIEGLQTLGIKSIDSTELLKAFCLGAEVKESEVSTAFMNLKGFKKAWCSLVDVESELSKRSLQIDTGLMVKSRNEERLLRHISSLEEMYFNNLSRISELVIDIKQLSRQMKDNRRKEEEDLRERLQRHAARFIADRGQEKRIQLKREQEERAKKRVEEKVMRNQLLLRQTENKLRIQEELAESIKVSENLRIEQIRARGWDRFDLSRLDLDEIPIDNYNTQNAQTRLSYAVVVDISKNNIENLPQSDFLYWLANVRHLNVSTNRLKLFPNELCLLSHLEILEGYNNRLQALPDDFGQLIHLLRLDLGSNQIEGLPTSIGLCKSLKYISLHSNQLSALPTSIGACMRLEYINLSFNTIIFLPEEIEFLISLTQLHLSSNRLLSLPISIGSCSKLEYLDVSCNFLSTLPESFSTLEKLEYCDLHNNDITLATKSLQNLNNLKYFNLNMNKIKSIHKDINGCQALVYLNLQNNQLTSISPEIGLLMNLEECNLSYNQLDSILVEIGACKGLIKLNLSHNQLQGTIVPTIALLNKLRELDMSNNNIDEIPPNIIGCQELRTLIGDHNKINCFPDTLFDLPNLIDVSFASNLFSHFPLQLSKISSLKSINFSENLIKLLPKDISHFSQLESLSLSKNQLEALPLEFIPIIEKVSNLCIDGNPWTLFPTRWGKLWEDKYTVEGSENGYELSHVLDFLYHMNIIYSHAEDEWKSSGALYYSKRRSFNDFLDVLKSKIIWNDGLISYAKYLFFKSCEKGIFPQWYLLGDDIITENKNLVQNDNDRRDNQVEKSNQEFISRMRRVFKAYDVDVPRRAKRSEEIAAEHRVNDSILYNREISALQSNIKEISPMFDLQKLKLEAQRKREDEEEYMRLIRLAKSDKLG